MLGTISRRDFLNGSALLIASGLTPLAQLRAKPGRYYPPALTGLRGSHVGSFEVAHQVGREGRTYDISTLAVEDGFDLVVVGGGISGLAAAWFYREAHGPAARILILDNHDDFGGHAKRNEFEVGGRLLIGYGGSESLQSPKAMFSATVNRLLKTLGVELRRWDRAFDRKLYPSLGLSEGVFFDRETFGVDRLVVGNPRVAASGTTAIPPQTRPITAAIDEFPFSDDAKSRLIGFFTRHKDYLAGRSRDEKIAYLRKTSYRDYLKNDAGLGEEAVKYFDGATKDFDGMGPDIMPALDALSGRYPGFAGLGLKDREEQGFDEPYIYHFPDGNASIARLLVRSLIRAAAPGKTMDDVVLADFDYARLDVPGAPIQLRLNSTGVTVANARGGYGPVDIGYVQAGALHRVQASHCVLAGYNMMIPYIMPDLPDAQKKGTCTFGKGAHGSYERCHSQLACVRQARRRPDLLPICVLHEHQARLPRLAGQLPQPARPGRAHVAPAFPCAPDAKPRAHQRAAIQAGTAAAAGNFVCRLRAADHRSARSRPRTRWLQVSARYRGHYC